MNAIEMGTMVEFNEERINISLMEEVSGGLRHWDDTKRKVSCGGGKGIHHINVAREHGKMVLFNTSLTIIKCTKAGDDEHWLIKTLKISFQYGGRT